MARRLLDPLPQSYPDDADDGSPSLSASHLSYAAALRIVGKHLDRRGAQTFHLLETPRWLFVRYFTADAPTRPRFHSFTFEELRREDDRCRRIAQIPDDGQFRKDHVGNGYAHYLRAIGSDLDELGARAIALDELDHELLITFSVRAGSAGSVFQKQLKRLGNHDRPDLIGAARRRRQRLPRLR
jgi:hypothetical protein